MKNIKAKSQRENLAMMKETKVIQITSIEEEKRKKKLWENAV